MNSAAMTPMKQYAMASLIPVNRYGTALGSFALGDAGAGLCRGVFGFGALVTLLFAVLLTRASFAKLRPKGS